MIAISIILIAIGIILIAISIIIIAIGIIMIAIGIIMIAINIIGSPLPTPLFHLFLVRHLIQNTIWSIFLWALVPH